ncbi:MAG TPA: ABC transporter permease, partial [Actinomycetota bacterium]|nr:ABC transporter permease [Actinomycetota bacterium]
MRANALASRRRLAPYMLTFPGGMWLLLFFIVPLVSVLSLSLQTGNYIEGFRLTWNVGIYWSALAEYHTQFARSFIYGAVSTLAALGIAYPVSYWIAF